MTEENLKKQENVEVKIKEGESRRKTTRRPYQRRTRKDMINKKEIVEQKNENNVETKKEEKSIKTNRGRRATRNIKEKTENKSIFKKSKLKIIPLGGLHEIGKNITVFEYEDEIIVVDCGLSFPEDDMLGVDLVIPDITYLEKNADKILKENSALGDMENLAFATTIAVSGHGEGIVTETGMNTKVGKIAQMIITDESPETPLQKRLRRSRKKIRNNCINNMYISLYNRLTKKNTCHGNIYDISWTSGCSNS